MSASLKILYVDDQKSMLLLVKKILNTCIFDIITSSSGNEALKIMQNDSPFFMVLTDYDMPVMKGTVLLQHIKQLYPHTVRALTSGGLDQQDADSYVQNGVCDFFFTKPWKSTELIEYLNTGMELYKSRAGQ
jgi:DNA-binding NtrC family response regulator